MAARDPMANNYFLFDHTRGLIIGPDFSLAGLHASGSISQPIL